MTVDAVQDEVHRAWRQLLVERLCEGPLGTVDRGLVEAAAAEVVGLVGPFLPEHDTSLVDAVRHFQDDHWLAACRFAPTSGGPTTRAVAARRVVRERVDAAFGKSRAERTMRTAVVRAYLDADGGHAAAQRELHLSRATFYRTLRRARARLGDLD